MAKGNRAHQMGLTIGALFGIVHLIWSILIAFGLAQPFIDFIFNLHMIEPFYVIQPFALSKAVGLVLVTSMLGYAAGYVLGTLWDMARRS